LAGNGIRGGLAHRAETRAKGAEFGPGLLIVRWRLCRSNTDWRVDLPFGPPAACPAPGQVPAARRLRRHAGTMAGVPRQKHQSAPRWAMAQRDIAI
jgi:hypothetical protein